MGRYVCSFVYISICIFVCMSDDMKYYERERGREGTRERGRGDKE